MSAAKRAKKSRRARRVRGARFDTLVAALHRIACWSEGEKVTGRFDEPGAAKTARDALAEVGIHGPPGGAP